MSKQTFTTAELAKLRLPGYPATPQGWDKRVKGEGWPVEVTRGRGRGGERHEYTPPSEVMTLIEKHLQGTLEPQVPPRPELPSGAGSRLVETEDEQRKRLVQQGMEAMREGAPPYLVAEPRPAAQGQIRNEGESQDEGRRQMLETLLVAAEHQLLRPLDYRTARLIGNIANAWRPFAERNPDLLVRLEALRTAADLYMAIGHDPR